jgi:kynurenine formamidase
MESQRRMSVFIDLTMPIAEGMPFNPDHFPPEITPYASVATGGWSASRLVLDSHLGTHMDAPCHFVAGGQSIDQVELDVLIGPAQVVHLEQIGEQEALTPAHFPVIDQARLLLHTGWSKRTLGTPAYFTRYPYLTPEAAEYLAGKGVRLVGLDCPSVDYDPGKTHVALLSRGTVIIENLVNLDHLPQSCTLMALPLPIKAGDGCPLRAVAQVN